MTKKYVIDAKGKVPGRIATEIAVLLMGKNQINFARNRIPDVEVEVTNTKSMKLEAKKLKTKSYYTHSGYPGSLKRRTQAMIVEKRGASNILHRAIYGMLPKNKLRAKMMTNLKIKE